MVIIPHHPNSTKLNCEIMTVITWDWKEQPCWGSVKAALKKVPDANIHEIETNEDAYGIVVGAFDQKEAQKYYDEHKWDDDAG